MKHKILIYGGQGDVASNRIVPALTLLKQEFHIEFSVVDIKDEGIEKYYKYGHEPLGNYNIAIIATPNDSHAEIAVKALNSGVHVLCEKPLAHTLEAAEEILSAAKKHPATIAMLSDHYLYKPAIRWVIQHWERCRSRIGEIRSVEAKIFEPPLQKGREWLLNSVISGGGVGMDTGIHLVSVIGRLFGYEEIIVNKVKITRHKGAPGDGETYASIMLIIGGVHAHIEVGKWMARTRKDIFFSGDRGKLEVDIEKGQVILDGKLEKSFSEDNSYFVLLAEFLSAIEGKGPVATTLQKGYEALRIINCAYKVAKGEVKC